MKKIRTSKLKFKSYPYKATKPDLYSYVSNDREAKQVSRFIRDNAVWSYNRLVQFNHNYGTVVKLVFRVAICALAIGLLYSLWDKPYSFKQWMHGLAVNDFSPFDYSVFVQKVNDAFDHLPGWLSGLRGIAQIAVAFGYSMEWLFNLLSYIFA